MFEWAHRQKIGDHLPDCVHEKIQGFFQKLGKGYYDSESDRILPGHLMALTLFIMTLGIYIIIGYFGFPEKATTSALFPPLGYLLLLFMIGIWGFSGVSFLLDRWRIPVLLTLLVFSFFWYWGLDADHYFETVPRSVHSGSPNPVLTPEKAVEAWFDNVGCRDPEGKMIVVLASGGGITASRWTTEVLTGLEEKFRESFTCNLSMISAVSGGSMGTMFYLDGFSRTPRDPEALKGVRQSSSESSLRAIAWGIAYADLWRLLFPPLLKFQPEVDRAWAMEKVLEQHLAKPGPTLMDWRGEIVSDQKPVPIFNAVTVETGDSYVFTPVSFQDEDNHHLDKPRQFFESYQNFIDKHPKRDIKLVTAARLSSTFPWVLPIFRPTKEPGKSSDKLADEDLDTVEQDKKEPPKSSYHLADGGYLDNFGIVTLVEWLETIAPTYQARGGREILLIQLRAFDKEPLPELLPKENRGWAFALYGPLLTMINVRSAGQSLINKQDVYLLQTKFQAMNMNLHFADFELDLNKLKEKKEDYSGSTQQSHANDCRDCAFYTGLQKNVTAPLSWHLSQKTINTIHQFWTKEFRDWKGDESTATQESIQNGLTTVKRFLVPQINSNQ